MACEDTRGGGRSQHGPSSGAGAQGRRGAGAQGRRGGVRTHAGQAGQLVVHHGGHVELEELHVLGDDMCRRAVLLVPPQLVVDLHDVGQLVRQVVLRRRVGVLTARRSGSPSPPGGRALPIPPLPGTEAPL